jgi:TatA/E family protein of Tat protein translocase
VDILGVGPLELIIVLIIALAVLGPERIPEIGAKLGRGLRDMRRATREFSKEIDATRQAIEAPMNEIAKPLQEIKASTDTLTQAAKAMRNPGKVLKESVMKELQFDETPVEVTAPASAPGEPSPSPVAAEGPIAPAAQDTSTPEPSLPEKDRAQANAANDENSDTSPAPSAPARLTITAELADPGDTAASTPPGDSNSESIG